MQDSSRSLAQPDASERAESVQRRRDFVIFEVSGRLVALCLDGIERIIPMAALATPPGLPSSLEGVLDLAGEAIPVLRLDRLLQLDPQRLGLYSALVMVRGVALSRIALLVDRVSGTLSIPEDCLLPLKDSDTLNGCAEATVLIQSEAAHVLSPSRILLTQEKDALAEFQAIVQSRLATWGGF